MTEALVGHVRFVWPIVAALRDLGGSARARDVIDLVLDNVDLSDDERAERLTSGALKVDNQVRWARQRLAETGWIDDSVHGVWTLTPSGWQDPPGGLTDSAARALVREANRTRRRPSSAATGSGTPSQDADEAVPGVGQAEGEELELRQKLREVLAGLSHAGFERLCKRLLAGLGLADVRTVGGAGDRGIDVEGRLRVSPVVSFRVGVQAKHYAEGNKVSPRAMREFQGALAPFDRGIFVTTSVFTRAAEEQATADQARPVELIDGERLIDLLIEQEMGTRVTTIVDDKFFEPFR